jgi:hypothetical protein
MFESHFNELNITHRERIASYNRAKGLKEGKTLLKLFSYCGAVAISQDCEHLPVHWADTSGRYYDPTNYVYARVFRAVWPRAWISNSNDKTVGDRVEAFLGYLWLARQRGIPRHQLINDIVQSLEPALLAAATLLFYYKVEV